MRFARVYLLGKDRRASEVGVIQSDGRHISYFPDEQVLLTIASEPIVAVSRGCLRGISPSDADEFLDCLNQQYRGTYLWVGKPEYGAPPQAKSRNPKAMRKDNPNHAPAGSPEGGQFTSGGGVSNVGIPSSVQRESASPQHEHLRNNELFNLIHNAEGFTYNAASDKIETEGFSVSMFPHDSQVYEIDGPKAINEDDVVKYFDDKLEALSKPENCFGAWWDKDGTGKVFLDVAMVVHDEKEAEAICFKYDQFGYFNLKTKETIRCNPNATSGGQIPPKPGKGFRDGRKPDDTRQRGGRQRGPPRAK